MATKMVDDGVCTSQFRLGHVSSGTSLIRSRHSQPFDVLFGRSEILLGALIGLGVASSIAWEVLGSESGILGGSELVVHGFLIWDLDWL